MTSSRSNSNDEEVGVETSATAMKLRRRRNLQVSSGDDLPDSVDWVEKGAIVAVIGRSGFGVNDFFHA